MDELDNKIKLLAEKIKQKKSVLVAFSGGVDSSVIAKAVYDALGNMSLAVTLDSEVMSRRELAIARRVAGEIGISHLVAPVPSMGEEALTNPANRCYHCKKDEIKALAEIARSRGIETIAFGVTTSDYQEHRPGLMALAEMKAFLPLVEAGIAKDEISRIARRFNLSNYDLPSTTCLASRIPYGERITPGKLQVIEQAEDFLLSLGCRQARVRHYNDTARIEVDPEEISLIVSQRSEIVSQFRQLGFKYVTLDLEGYRSGSMNAVLREKGANS